MLVLSRLPTYMFENGPNRPFWQKTPQYKAFSGGPFSYCWPKTGQQNGPMDENRLLSARSGAIGKIAS
jgi:hypothetical protein